MKSEKILFEGNQGQLAARLDLPSQAPIAYAIFAHCFTCSKDIFAASRIASELASQGIAVLRFDFTGLGASEGEFANTNFSSNMDDLRRAADYLRDNHEAPQLLIGHSLGGAAVLGVAGDVPEVKAVATIGAPFAVDHVAHHFGEKIDDIESNGEAEVTIAGRPFKVRKQFLDDIRGHDQGARIEKLRKALLVLHSPIDQTVGIDNASNIFIAAKHPKSFLSLDGADHLLSDRDDARYAARAIAAWALRYLDVSAASHIDWDRMPKAKEDATIVVDQGLGFTNGILSAGHRLVADEPPSVGGANMGPTPYGLLMSALGACTTMTMRMYANHKKIPLEGSTVELRHEKIHANDCSDCETKEGKIDQITRKITLKGELTDEQRDGLIRIADKCPVHRTLHSEVKITTERG